MTWELHAAGKAGPLLKKDAFTLHIPLGEFATQDIAFDVPHTPGDLSLTVTSSKGGQVRFADDLIGYRAAPPIVANIPDGDYLLTNVYSALVIGPGLDQGAAAVLQQRSKASLVWHLTSLGGGDVRLADKATGQVLGVAGTDDGAPAVPQAADGSDRQVWHLDVLDAKTDPPTDNRFTLTNKATGERLDIEAGAVVVGARAVQRKANTSSSQQWELH